MSLLNNYFDRMREAIRKDLRMEMLDQQLLLGRMMSDRVRSKDKIVSLKEVEFKVFSQWGDDGIIQYLTGKVDCAKTFIEFGVEDYQESNTRFLLFNDNWSGLVMDGSPQHIQRLKGQPWFWKFDLKAKAAFITKENINDLITAEGLRGEIGLLHIDIDGNDYWVWKEILAVNPAIAIIEYNSVFGAERAITVPYAADFYRTNAHYSNLYFGASLPALCDLAREKGYSFIGCNSNGNNAYFVRNDKVGDLKVLDVKDGYVESKFRESRDKDGQLSLLSGKDRLEALRGMPVFDTRTGALTTL
jgi:hypothetical protein